jgi:hypothetical protein
MAVIKTGGILRARAHEKVATLTSSTGLTSTNYILADPTGKLDKANLADEVVVTVETADIRWTMDGTVPTVTAGTGLGHIASAGDVITITGHEQIKAFRAINAVDASGANLRVTFLFRR